MRYCEEQRGQRVGGSGEKNVVNFSRQYEYKMKEMIMGGSRLACQTRKTCLWETSANGQVA